MHELSLKQLSAALARGDFSSEELTRHFLDRVERLDRVRPVARHEEHVAGPQLGGGPAVVGPQRSLPFPVPTRPGPERSCGERRLRGDQQEALAPAQLDVEAVEAVAVVVPGRAAARAGDPDPQRPGAKGKLVVLPQRGQDRGPGALLALMANSGN